MQQNGAGCKFCCENFQVLLSSRRQARRICPEKSSRLQWTGCADGKVGPDAAAPRFISKPSSPVWCGWNRSQCMQIACPFSKKFTPLLLVVFLEFYSCLIRFLLTLDATRRVCHWQLLICHIVTTETSFAFTVQLGHYSKRRINVMNM